jgi:hypothetical protein
MGKQLKKQSAAVSMGLAAIGSDLGWEIALDESSSPTAEEWVAQIEGPSMYLSFRVQSPCIIKEMVGFLVHADRTREELLLGKTKKESVTLARDDESDDRYFLIVQTESSVTRVTFAGDDLKCLTNALRQASEDIADAD